MTNTELRARPSCSWQSRRPGRGLLRAPGTERPAHSPAQVARACLSIVRGNGIVHCADLACLFFQISFSYLFALFGLCA